MIYYALFYFKHPSTTQIYTLSLHDALPISPQCRARIFSMAETASTLPSLNGCAGPAAAARAPSPPEPITTRSEEHTSELQSLRHLVCRLLLEKKKKKKITKLIETMKDIKQT